MFHGKHESLKLLGLSGCVALWRGPSPDLFGYPMRALLLRGLGIFIGSVGHLDVKESVAVFSRELWVGVVARVLFSGTKLLYTSEWKA